jgi:hypothetical protein
MNRDDMIRMAREAGWEYATDDRGFEPLWRFAALVAAAEAAKWAQGAKISVPTEAMEQQFSVYHKRGFEAGKLAGAAADRERIAALVEQMGIDGYGTLAIAAAIRKGQA